MFKNKRSILKKKYLPIQRKLKYDLQEIENAIFGLLRIGSQWRNIPLNFPPWQSVYYYFRIWTRDRIIEKMSSGLNKKERKRQGKKGVLDVLSIYN